MKGSGVEEGRGGCVGRLRGKESVSAELSWVGRRRVRRSEVTPPVQFNLLGAIQDFE